MAKMTILAPNGCAVKERWERFTSREKRIEPEIFEYVEAWPVMDSNDGCDRMTRRVVEL